MRFCHTDFGLALPGFAQVTLRRFPCPDVAAPPDDAVVFDVELIEIEGPLVPRRVAVRVESAATRGRGYGEGLIEARWMCPRCQRSLPRNLLIH